LKSVKISTQKTGLSGTLSFPGDKSLSHRAIIFGSLAEGTSHFTNVLPGEDCVCTRKAFEAMGVKIKSSKDATELTIEGVGLKGLKQPKSELYLGNSGTSMRLLMGVLAGQSFQATLTGDPSLSSRPMRRVADPLRQMGAQIDGREGGNFAPITITGSKLTGINYEMPMASAQVKSAILLAGLYAEGPTRVKEALPSKEFNQSRDHTERFLTYFGADIKVDGILISVNGRKSLKWCSFPIAGDISSAAFFMVATAIVSGSKIAFKDILYNPTRREIVRVLDRAGISMLEVSPIKKLGPEEAIDFTITPPSDLLKAFEITRDQIPFLVDEIPILCVLATQAKGKSIIHDADELRVKETDRIQSMVSQLSKMGADIKAEGNSIIINGPTPLTGAVVNSFKDHRTAMSLIVAGLIAAGETIVEDIECIDTSFPNFFELLSSLKLNYKILTR